MALEIGWREKWPASLTAIERYGTAQQFLEQFALSHTGEYTSAVGIHTIEEVRERCVTGHAPTLAIVGNAWGAEVAEMWLSGFIAALYEICGQKISAPQLEALTHSWLANEHYVTLKVTDYMLFSQKFLAGEYGDFFGTNNPLHLSSALREYCRHRQGVINDHHRKEQSKINKAVQEERENGITLAEYCSTLPPETTMAPSHKSFLKTFLAATPYDIAAVDAIKDGAEIENKAPNLDEKSKA